MEIQWNYSNKEMVKETLKFLYLTPICLILCNIFHPAYGISFTS